ncbi:Clp protease ClpB [Cytobacillus gottheilii]|uniref:Clp protease ClpB n=1 Tax=Cytobacillus gottheilii TaxID=859144 RepID=A0ABX8FG59_9BACI|nr:Clp protease ClpB [Cytobacillus gottheilii]QVY62982.1 Clp protease ClpB [Cytobacillus gottheilii]
MSEELNTQIQTEVEPVQTTEETTPAVEEAKTFTQDEVNELIAKRLEREKKKFDKFADYDEIKTKATEYEKALEEKRLAELSENERLAEIAKKHEEEKQSLAAELEKMREGVKAEKIRNEFIKVATSNQIGYLDDAFNLADLSAVTIGDDGKVVGMDEAVKALVDNKPFLVAKKQAPQIGESFNGGSEKQAEKTADQLLKDAAEKARASGRAEDLAAYAKLRRELGK